MTKRTSKKPKRTSRRNGRSYEVKWFIVARDEHGRVSKDSWLQKWGAPSKAKLAKLVAGASGARVVDARVVRAGEVDRAMAEMRLHRNGYGRSYGGDPRWITARFDSVDDEGNKVRRGDEVLYWPSTKRVMTGAKAKDAWQRFLSEKGDEEGTPYARNPRRRTSRNPKRKVRRMRANHAKGDRVQLHPGTDRWMMGDRFGNVTSVRKKDGAVRVKLDRSGKSLWFRPQDVMLVW